MLLASLASLARAVCFSHAPVICPYCSRRFVFAPSRFDQFKALSPPKGPPGSPSGVSGVRGQPTPPKSSFAHCASRGRGTAIPHSALSSLIHLDPVAPASIHPSSLHPPPPSKFTRIALIHFDSPGSAIGWRGGFRTFRSPLLARIATRSVAGRSGFASPLPNSPAQRSLPQSRMPLMKAST